MYSAVQRIRRDLSGTQIGWLTVIALLDSAEKQQRMWLCRCACGKEVGYSSAQLKSKRKMQRANCGCKKKLYYSAKEIHRKSLQGQRFHRWEVLCPDLHSEHKGGHWICLCDCGSIHSVDSSALIRNQSKSCGCWRSEAALKHITENRHKFKMRKGKDHYWFNPEMSDEDRKSRRTSWWALKWHKEVMAKCASLCQICGQNKPHMAAHHLVPWSRSKELRFEPNNGVALCPSCHAKYHGKYPAKTATPQNFEEYKHSAIRRSL